MKGDEEDLEVVNEEREVTDVLRTKETHPS